MMTTAPIDPQRCVLVPSYNSGPLLAATLRTVLAHWRPVIVVDDGSTDESMSAIGALAQQHDGVHLVRLPRNSGKGAAVRAGLEYAAEQGWTHAATFDADGQHHAPDLPRFMEASQARPDAIVAGLPVFGADAPRIRIIGHRIANWCTRFETAGRGPADSLCGFRVYPVRSALAALQATQRGRGFDFETEIGVRLSHSGVPCLDLPTAVRYASRQPSHFRYWRDNLLLGRTHAGLLASAAAIFRQRHEPGHNLLERAV
jgi:glycosyltransferase involved in cell wall biosynthesis